MTLATFARMVQEMRLAQKAYFAARRRGEAATGDLEASKRLERLIDKTCDEILEGPTLFDGSDDA